VKKPKDISVIMAKVANAKPLWKKQLSQHKSKLVKLTKAKSK
jgi:hypothetical protein